MRGFVYRRVPFLLAVSTLVGNSFQLFGWFFLGFGAIFASVFLRMADLNTYEFGKGTQVVDAIIVKKEASKANINKVRVQRYFFKFKDSGGREREGVSYATRLLGVGDKVRAEYMPGNPGWSRIEGMRLKEFGPEVLFILIFPFIGFMLVFVPFLFGWRKLNLLKNGVLTKGVICDRKQTSMRVNRRNVIKYTFKFKDSKGREQLMTQKTHCSDAVEDEHEERILYDPDRPSNACLVDLVKSGLEFDEKGELAGYSSVRAFFSILFPLGVVGALIVAAVLMK